MAGLPGCYSVDVAENGAELRRCHILGSSVIFLTYTEYCPEAGERMQFFSNALEFGPKQRNGGKLQIGEVPTYQRG